MKTYRKNILRTLKSTRSRFIAIFSIVALGVGFLAGLVSTTPDMRDSVETYLDGANLYDFRVLSTLGLTDDDVAALAAVDGVQSIRPAYSVDLMIATGGPDESVARFHSLPMDAAGNPEGPDTISSLTLVDGRWPTAPNECVVEAGAGDLTETLPLGTTVTASADNEGLDDALAVTEYTVVGIAHDATYFSFEREPASVGAGTLEYVLYILPEAFSYEAYTELYLTVSGARSLDSMQDEYTDAVDAVTARVEEISGARCEARYEEVVGDAQAEIDDAWAEYYDAEQEAETELADAARQLADGRDALADGEKELADGEKEYNDGVAELNDNARLVADGITALDAARTQLEEGQAAWDEGWQQYLDGAAQLDAARRQLEDGQRQYDEGKAAYDAALAAIEAGETQLVDGKAKLDAAQAEYDAGRAALDEADSQLAQLQQMHDGEAAYWEGVTQLAEQLSAAGLPVTPQQVDEAVAALAALPAGDQPETAAALLQYLMERLGLTAGAAVPQALCAELGSLADDAGAAAEVPQRIATAETAALDDTQEPSDSPQTDISDWISPDDLAALQGWLEEIAADPEAALDAAQQLLDRITAALPEDAPAEIWDLLDRVQQALDNAGDTLAKLEELAAGVRALVDARRQLDAGLAAILAAQPDLSEEEVRALYSEESLAALRQQADEGRKTLADAKAQLDAGWAEYNANAAALAEGRAALAESLPVLEASRLQLEEGWTAYNAGAAEAEEGRQTLLDTRQTLLDGWQTLADKQYELNDAQRQIDEARQTLADAAAELADARRTIAEKKQELLDGEAEYADAKAEADEKLADARATIEDAEAQLADVNLPEWYVWNRGYNVSYASFKSNSAKLEALTRIFPVFFFLVAALVVSTTMTRMVEEERLQIGAMKALGYTRADIMQKYLFYALAAAVTGAGFGLVIGFTVFPRVIWTAYQMMYYAPAFYASWRGGIALFSGGLLVLCALAATWSACSTTLHETPAALMRPRAPKAGKRILLERVGFLWRRLPFSYKVTCRNLMRYKKRFWMTVIGVAGCTALLVTGFGIRDSLNSIVTKQFDDISFYQLTTTVTDAEATRSGDVYDYLFGDPTFSASIATASEKVTQTLDSGTRVETYILVPADVTEFSEFIDLHERVSGKPTPLGETGVVLTEKLASAYGVKAGDTVAIENADGGKAEFTVSGVCENYVYNYIYMSAATYQAGFGTAPDWNTILSIMPDDSEPIRDAVSARLLAMDDVASLSFTVDLMTMVLNMLHSINAVVVLIVVCAAGLAFIVLYNLSNINIAERVKEIATIKVLGFYDREVNSYVNRESVALTVIGALLGLVLGIALHQFVIVTVEVDSVMFGRSIHPLSFVYALGLTLLFSLIVNAVMSRKLKQVSMVESMKAPE